MVPDTVVLSFIIINVFKRRSSKKRGSKMSLFATRDRLIGDETYNSVLRSDTPRSECFTVTDTIGVQGKQT